MLTLTFSSFESPFPLSDSAHRGSLRVQNDTAAAVQFTGYTVQLVATAADVAPVLLQTDNSDQHQGYTPVQDGLFLFITQRSGVCIEPLHFVDFPLTLAADEAQEVPFYLYDLDLATSLAPQSLPDVALALHAELRYEAASGPAMLTAEQAVELTE